MRYLTIVLRVPDDYKPEEINHPYFSAASWSHALDIRDSYKADAERYRWLKEQLDAPWWLTTNRAPHIEQYPHQDNDLVRYPQIKDVGLDAAIDFAREHPRNNLK